jgi:membrane-associated phospholipid phosphatase
MPLSMPPAPAHRPSRLPALTVMLLASAAWALLAWQVHSGGPLLAWDDQLARWVHQVAQPGLIQSFSLLSAAHTLPPLLAASLVLGGWAWWRGDRFWSWLLPLSLMGGACLNMAWKGYFERERPGYSGLADLISSYSFPSGHALHAGVFYGMLALMAWQKLAEQPGRRALVVAAALLMAVLVAASRVVLGVHYLADVVAGLLGGLAWSALLMAILVPPFRAPR